MFTECLTQALAPADYVAPQGVTNTTISTNGLDMSKAKRAIFYVQAGSVGGAGTIAITPQSAKLSNFATPHNMTGFTITNIASNNVAISIEVRSDQVTQQNSGDRYVRLNLTGAGNPVTVGVLGVLGEGIQGPVNTILNTSIITQQVLCTT